MKAFSKETNYKPTDLKVGDLVVWYIPQVPMKCFHVKVDSWDQASEVQDLLACYDQFQHDHNIKPDYCNTSGIQIYGGQKYLDEYRDEVDQSEWSDDISDALCDVEHEFDYEEQLKYLGISNEHKEKDC
jgi:Superinfection exclusion gene product 17